MGWKRSTLRAAANLTNGVSDDKTITGMRDATRLIIIAKATDANTLSTYALEHKSLDGNDSYMTENAATASGDAIVSQTLNVNTSGATGSVGRRAIYTWTNGCPWNTLKVRLTAGGITVAGLQVDALWHVPGSDSVGPTSFAD